MTDIEAFNFIEKEHNEMGIPYAVLARKIGISKIYLYFLRSNRRPMTPQVIAKVEAYAQKRASN